MHAQIFAHFGERHSRFESNLNSLVRVACDILYAAEFVNPQETSVSNAAPTAHRDSAAASDWLKIQDALNLVGQHLEKPTRLVLIGSSVGMWYGQPGRMTEDVDIWSPRSEVDYADIKQACEKAGIHFDPRGYDVPRDGLYLQIVTPGVVHVGQWKDEARMFKSGKLEVVHPPAENIIASKLVRAAAHDIDDIVFLMTRLQIGLNQVRAAVETLPEVPRETAQENMVFLEIREELLGDVNEFVERKKPKAARGARP
ncbi:hypothetical protein ABIC83_003080 [Roseateles asaccharophilus]|uniref:hypothetical protein n=1 Tax=Roseateles asaccharophilus TaxID=582607 RepID=UPI003834EEE4